MHPDHAEYQRFTGPARVERAVNSLAGLVEGIAIDSRISPAEIGFIEMWLTDHADRESLHPFNELVPVVRAALHDGVLSEDEKKDILWLCDRLTQADYFNVVTADMQRLHAVLGGIAADGEISVDELRGLSKWLEEHDHLRTCWPYDEVDSLVTSVLADKKVDAAEHAALLQFFGEFTAKLDDRTITAPSVAIEGKVTGLCAVCPEIIFVERTFAFTGASSRLKRSDLRVLVESLGGRALTGPSSKLHYLIIGAEGNPCWAYACYGRKVEEAVKLRKQGAKLMLVHENDFHDAVEDARR